MPPVETFVVEVAEEHEHAKTLLVTIDPYQAFALAEAALACAIDPPDGSRAGDLDFIIVRHFAGVEIEQWDRTRRDRRADQTRAIYLGIGAITAKEYPPYTPWWEKDEKALKFAVGPWSPWTWVPCNDDQRAAAAYVAIDHVKLLQRLGERSDLLVIAAERAMELSQKLHDAKTYQANEFGSVLERL